MEITFFTFCRKHQLTESIVADCQKGNIQIENDNKDIIKLFIVIFICKKHNVLKSNVHIPQKYLHSMFMYSLRYIYVHKIQTQQSICFLSFETVEFT